jgi:antitoxin MazE
VGQDGHFIDFWTLLGIFIVDTSEASMKTRVQKWGNSLAVRIPKSFAADVGLEPNSAVDMSLVKGSVVVTPIAQRPVLLKELLRGVTNENLPGEWNTGPTIGKEVL